MSVKVYRHTPDGLQSEAAIFNSLPRDRLYSIHLAMRAERRELRADFARFRRRAWIVIAASLALWGATLAWLAMVIG